MLSEEAWVGRVDHLRADNVLASIQYLNRLGWSLTRLLSVPSISELHWPLRCTAPELLDIGVFTIFCRHF